MSTRSTLSLCTGVEMTTPSASVRASSARTSLSTTTTYRFSCRRPLRSTALGNLPSLVSKMSPVESLSRRPTGKMRSGWPTASMMFERSRRSVVHVTPRGFQYLTYRNCDSAATASSITASVSHRTGRPSRATTSPGKTRAPASARTPLTDTLPSPTSRSASRRDVKSLKHLLMRTPPEAGGDRGGEETSEKTGREAPRERPRRPGPLATSTTRKVSPGARGAAVERCQARVRLALACFHAPSSPRGVPRGGVAGLGSPPAGGVPGGSARALAASGSAAAARGVAAATWASASRRKPGPRPAAASGGAARRGARPRHRGDPPTTATAARDTRGEPGRMRRRVTRARRGAQREGERARRGRHRSTRIGVAPSRLAECRGGACGRRATRDVDRRRARNARTKSASTTG